MRVRGKGDVQKHLPHLLFTIPRIHIKVSRYLMFGYIYRWDNCKHFLMENLYGASWLKRKSLPNSSLIAQ